MTSLFVRNVTFFTLVAEAGFERCDLRVMGPTSYRTALLRDVCLGRRSIYLLPRTGIVDTRLFTILSSCVFRFKFSL